MSLLGSRVVLALRTRSETPRKPSAGAQALALLLEDPKRAYEAAEIAERLDCSVPIARTTLNRLVQSGHATRVAAGRFRAKAR
jgi:DNA-binding IclR family transcriptional regulator